MQHRSIRRDPTVLLVAALVAVVVVALVVTRLASGSDTEPASATPSDSLTGLPSAPTATPTPTPTVKPNGRVMLPRKPAGKATCVTEEHDTEIVAVSYNIKSGHGGGSLSAIADTLAASEADVVLLQEIDQFRATSGGVDMPAYFGERLGMYHTFGGNVFYGGAKQYGTAILSKYPILSAENTHLPRPGTTQQRGLLHAVIDVDGKKVSLYNTHLQNLSEPARMLQVAAINTIVASDPRPQILGGDFNAQPESRPLQVLKTHWVDTWGTVGVGTGRTHPAHNLRGRIDYLMSSGAGITPLAADVLPARLSDHMAVRALYNVEGKDEKVCVQLLGEGQLPPASTTR